MKKKVPVIVLSFIAATALVYFGVKLFLSPEQLKILIEKPFEFHLYSCLLGLPIYFLGGLRSYILFRRMSNTRISLYDTLTLPFVISLWGFLIPFQGSFIYNSVYFKAKYKINIVNTTSIFILSFSVSLIIAGILGTIYSLFIYRNIYFMLLSIVSFLHPVFVFAFLKASGELKPSKHPFIAKVRTQIETIFGDYLGALNFNSILLLSVMNLLDALAFSIWSVWISSHLGLDLSFFQLLILAFFIKLTLLFKFTPGNLGINQFASSGIILLVGGTSANGFTLSLYQSAVIIITSFLIGAVVSLVNIKYFFKKQ